MDIQSFLANNLFFHGLPPSEQEYLAQRLVEIDLPAGVFLFHEGDQSEHFYLVVDGRVDILKAVGTPEESVLSQRGSGDFIGEMGFLNQSGLRTASVKAFDDARLIQISFADFHHLISSNPQLAFELASVLSQRMTDTQDNAISTLQEKNLRLQQAYDELKAAQAQLVEKEKMERELELARQIQCSILPVTLPKAPGYDFGALMEPARSVSGDFFSIFTLEKGLVAVVVGDVTDKGVPSALFMAQSHALLRALASADRSPGETLRMVNDLLLEMNEMGMFVTIVYGILDPLSGVFEYARAGHELPLLMYPDGQVQFTPHSIGVPLGLFEELKLDENHLTLPPGGALVLYSDGVPDGANLSGGNFGYPGMEEIAQKVIARNLHQDAQQICKSIYQAVIDFQNGAVQFDDITLLAISRSAT